MSQIHNIETNREFVQSMKSKADAQRNRSEKLADQLTQWSGSILFFMLNMVWFGA